MKYCPFCKRLNSGRPRICRYCGRSWHQRLCPRGHENPHNAQYCGDCGSTELTETVGPRSWRVQLSLLAGLLLLGTVVIYTLQHLLQFLRSSGESILCYLNDNAFVIILLSVLFYILPDFMKKPVKGILSLSFQAIRRVASFIIWLLKLILVGKNKKSRGAG